MKDFVKMTLAVICGLLIVSILSGILMFGLIGAAAVSGSGQPTLPKSGVLKIDMSKITLDEQTEEGNPLASLGSIPVGAVSLSIPKGKIGLWDAVCAVNAAAEDPAVKFIYLKTDGTVTGVAHLQEFRHALSNFRSVSSKPIVAYIESPTTGSYYLASVADKIYMTSNIGATTQVSGVSSQMTFFGDLLKKLGVNVQLIRHGKYKSAGETFTRGSASPENREQYQVMVNSIWSSLSSEIAESRDLTVEEINSAIDNLKLLEPTDFLENKFVDGLLTRSELEAKLADLAVVSKFKEVKFISFSDYVTVKAVTAKVKDKIAIIYANGEIIDGSAKSEVAGDRFASIIEKVRADSTVKAVVLRVNSPGGSVLASDKIKTEIDLLKGTKPVIASFGAYAASGGYWISNSCDKIFSDAVTLTGSIGVFGMFPDFSKVLKDVAHVGIESVSSNKHGDMLSLMRPFDEDETAYLQRSIEDVYERFTTIVAEGRGLDKDFVDEVGQGRVWTGADALTIHLVDEIGGLEDAVKYAAVAAGEPDMTKWNVKDYPRAPSQMETILSSLQGTDSNDYSVLTDQFKDLKSGKILARLPYMLEIK